MIMTTQQAWEDNNNIQIIEGNTFLSYGKNEMIAGKEAEYELSYQKKLQKDGKEHEHQDHLG